MPQCVGVPCSRGDAPAASGLDAGMMTLRVRLAAILAVVVVAANGLLLYVGARVVATGFGALEHDQAAYRASLAARQIGDETKRIGELAVDYAAWDDMRLYVAHASDPFIDSALPPNWLPRVRLHVVAVVDSRGVVLFSRHWKEGLTSSDLPDGLRAHLQLWSPLLAHTGPDSSRSGILMLPDGPWIVASRPIVSSEGDGPMDGTFVLGRRMDADLLGQFSDAIALPVHLEPPAGGPSPVGAEPAIRVDSGDAMTVLVPLTDIYSRPASLVAVSMPRAVEAQRRGTEYYLAWSFLVASTVFLIAVIALLNHYIVKRMAILAGFLRDVHTSGNLGSRLLPAGATDEIGQLATEINDLLTTIETRNRDLERARAQALGAMRESEGKNRQLEEANLLIERLARTDPLTQLANRRMFDECLTRQVSRSGRQGESFTIVMADLDDFKSMNDDCGHLVGDEILIQTADAISARVRGHDVAARYGGEEFVLLMANATLVDGVTVAERIRAQVERLEVPGYPRRVTMSLGVAEWVPGESPSAVLARADAALFRAKRAGRNRVEAHATIREVETIVRTA